uniref:Uncharacterized protein n=1 Tax=Candidatus Kentrum sp. LFY TaxID=2126342 RepID=A0A450UJU9_9GAMM|nr:MAG: hypothetical protein BECKLFY1418A_GA0070994_10267 [Candidatus Kentron sp. LFY]
MIGRSACAFPSDPTDQRTIHGEKNGSPMAGGSMNNGEKKTAIENPPHACIVLLAAGNSHADDGSIRDDCRGKKANHRGDSKD